jgi:hypothetical protein
MKKRRNNFLGTVKTIYILFVVIWILAFPFILLIYSLMKENIFLIVLSGINLLTFGAFVKLFENKGK